MTFESSLWTGRNPNIKIHCGIKGPKQLPLFMIWAVEYENIENDYEPIMGWVIFNSLDWVGK